MSEVNEELIRKYKNDKVLIKTFYTDTHGVNIDGIVNPLKIDNKQLMSPTDDQTRYPACAGYSACTLIESIIWKKTGKLVQLDSKQVYAKAKEMDGERDADGTYLETALGAALQLCDVDFLKTAKIGMFSNGRNRDTIENVKHLVHVHDFLQVGFQIDESWYSRGAMNYIIEEGGKPLGGHAINIAGYDSRGFYILNQWGKSWGAKGYAIIPYDIFLRELMYGTYVYGITY